MDHSFSQDEAEGTTLKTAPEYPLELVAELCDILQIDLAGAASVQSELNSMARTWWTFSHGANKHVPRVQQNEELKQLSDAAKQMAEAVANMSDAAWASLEDTSHPLGLDQLAVEIRDDEGRAVDWELIPIFSLPKESFEQNLRAIHKVASAIPVIEPTRRGTRPDAALKRWMEDARRFVTAASQQGFKRDVADDGEPITPAARFCVKAFAHISPDTESAKVLTAMKNNITEHNKTRRWQS
jgi:hypothetical protein